MKLASKFGLAIFLMIFGALDVHAQAAHYHDVATTNLGGFLHVISKATIRLCTASATGTPCTPTVQAYSDIALTQPLATPFNADVNGNYDFYVAAGTYQLQISSLGVATQTIANLQLGVGGGGGTPGGATTNCQSNQSGAFYGDAGCTYNTTTQSLGGLSGFLITPSQAGTFAAPTVTPNSTASTGYCYTIVAYKGNVPIAISGQTCITNGPTTIDSSHTVSVSWAAVLGAQKYYVWRDMNPDAGLAVPTVVQGIVATISAPTIAATDNITNATGPFTTPYPAIGGTGITQPLVLGDSFPTSGGRFWTGDSTTASPSLQIYQNSRGAPAIHIATQNDIGVQIIGYSDANFDARGLLGAAFNTSSTVSSGQAVGMSGQAGNTGTGSIPLAVAGIFEIDNENSGQVAQAATVIADSPLIIFPATSSTTTEQDGLLVRDQSGNGVTSYGIHILSQANNGASHPYFAMDGATSGTSVINPPATGGGVATLPTGSGTLCYSPCGAGSGVSSWSGDGAFYSNSGSTGAVTATLTVAGAHQWWGNNTSSTATPGYESLTGADLPNPGPSSKGGIDSITCASHQWINVLSTAGVPSCTQPTLADIAAGVAPTGTFDFSGVTIFKTRVAAGLSTSVNGDFGYDTTNKNWHFWDNGADSLAAIFSGSLTNGHCAQIQISSGVTNIIDAGAACGGAGGASWSGVTNGTNTNAGSFISTGNTWDFSGVTLFKLRVGATATTTVNGDIVYDTTNKNWHGWNNGADLLFPEVPIGTPVNGDCVNWVVSSGNVRFGDAGAACGSGGGGSGTVTSIVFSSPLTGGTITTTGTVGCPTCVISGASLTNNQLIFGAGGQSVAVGNLTGDVTTSGGKTTAVTNIPTGVTMAGFLTATTVTAPATPAAGHVQIWTDLTNAVLSSKNAAGVVSNTVVPNTLAAHNFVNAISVSGVVSGAQPAFTDISGAISFTQFPTPSANGDIPCVVSLAWTECTPGAPVIAKTAGYTFVQGDNGNIFTISDTSASTFTLSAASGFSSGYRTALLNINTGLATLSGSVNGGSTQIVPQNWFAPIYNTGSVWFAPTMPTLAAFPNCPDTGGNHLNIVIATGVFSCGTSSSGGSGISGLTTNVITKATSSTTIGNSSITDNGTTVSTTEPLTATSVATGTSPPTCTAGSSGVLCLAEGTTPTGASAVDMLWADSTNHCLHANMNNVDTGCVQTPLVSFTSSSQTGSLGSTSVVSSTAQDGFWMFAVTANVTSSTGTPTMSVNIGPNCTSATNSSLSVGTATFGFAASSVNTQCVPTFLVSGSAINVSTTVGGTGTIAYTLTVKAKYVN
jgi:hypothetical protein